MSEFKGIDVSKYQGDINWAQVKQSGIEFSIIRVGYATTIDPYFIKNIEGALAQGIKCGCYLYSYATTVNEATKEANFVIKTIKPYDIVYPVAFDIEDSSQSSLSKTVITDLIVTFNDIIVAGGYTPAVYSSLSWFKTKFDLTRLNNYDKWVAAWNKTPPVFEQGYSIWQNSDSGVVSGISGNVDTNISYKNYGLLASSTKSSTPSSTSNTTNTTTTKYTAGTKINLVNVPLYASSTTSTKANTLNGTYWIYNGKITNNRLSITNSADKVNKNPASSNVTGYVNISDL